MQHWERKYMAGAGAETQHEEYSFYCGCTVLFSCQKGFTQSFFPHLEVNAPRHLFGPDIHSDRIVNPHHRAMSVGTGPVSPPSVVPIQTASLKPAGKGPRASLRYLCQGTLHQIPISGNLPSVHPYEPLRRGQRPLRPGSPQRAAAP